MGLRNICLFFVLALTVAQCINYCQVQSHEIKVFTTPKEIQQIPLSKYIRGYDLDFITSDEKTVHIFEPYHVAEQADFTLKSGYSIISVDGRNSDTHLWTRHGIMFAQGEKGVAVGYGEFSSGVLPKIERFNYLDFPYVAECYSGLIYNSNLDVVIDCEKVVPKAEDRTDITCLITQDSELICKEFDSITKTSKRKSVIYSLGSQRFLISSALSDHISADFQNETFLTIYHIVDKSVQFNLIVDRRTLGLESLSINDIDVIQIQGQDHIVLTDTSSRLIIFRYTEINTVDNVIIVNVEGTPFQFATSPQGIWLVANRKHVVECTYSQTSRSITVVRRYELDPAITKVVDLQASYRFLVVRSDLSLYTYQAQLTDLKYLLNQEDISESTSVVVSPFYPRLFMINNTKMTSVAITTGYLYISQVQASTDVLITAVSGNANCVINVKIQFVSGENKIYQKKTLTSSYRLESNTPIRFNLADYFGGINLRYKASSTSPQVRYSLEHINAYTQQLTEDGETLLFQKIVEIDEKSYWLAKFFDVAARFYKCQLGEAADITCTENEKEKFDPKGLTFSNADGALRQNGNAVLSWTYKNSNRVQIKKLGYPGQTAIFVGYQSRFSQVLVGQKYIVYVEKQLGRLSFYDTAAINFKMFSYNDFSEADLKMMGGFYPRQVMSSHHNPHIFFIKFPISIVTVSYIGGKELEILSVSPVSKTYIPDDSWSLVVGKQTLLLFTPDQVAEYVVLADSNIQKLHSIPLNKKPVFPIRYQLKTDTAYFECDDGSIQYIRLGQPALDSQYYALDLKTKSKNGAADWDASGSWLVTSGGQAYFQYEEPRLVLTSVVPDTVYRTDVSLSLIVLSDNEEKDVVANVTAFNYPIKIQKSNAEDNGLVLPQKGDDQLIPFPLTKYFTGSVAKYTIVCPYCLDGTISLVPPLRKIKQNTELNNFEAVVTYDNSGVLVLLQNSLKLLNVSNSVIFEKNIDTNGKCTSMGTNLGYLIVYCVDNDGNQQLFLYQLITASATRDIVLKGNYLIPAEAAVLNPSQIGLYYNEGVFIIFIHDVDLMNPTAKDSNIKIFELTDAINFKGVIDSTKFNLIIFEPINSMSIHNDHMLVTVGGKGLGYINLKKYADNGDFINLEDEPSLANYTLDDTLYLRVVISQSSNQLVEALVSTSNSLSYVLQFAFKDGSIVFVKVAETYNRYNHQMSLNWGLIDNKYVILSYYNKEKSTLSLALYQRNPKGIVQFFTTEQQVIPLNILKPPKAALVHTQAISEKNSFLFINSIDKPAASGSLVLYNVTEEYNLLIKYDKPSSSNTIKVTATNDYYSVSRDLSVEFEGSSGGVKWYSIVIVVVLVAIAVGIAFGLYLRMKRRRADSKKVSLFTENQEIDEQV